MGNIIAITIQKGGVGKSTTAHELGAGLAERGYRVLLVDMDPQQNLSRMAGADFEIVSIYDVLNGYVTTKDAIQQLEALDMIIADKQLKSADRDFSGENDIFRVAAVLLDVKEEYDYILIDTPPSLGILPSMALCAADYCLIPCEASSNGIQGLGQLAENIAEIKRLYNPDLQTLGIVLTRYTWRTIFNRQMKEDIGQIAAGMGTRVLDTYIRTAVVVQEAQGFSQSLVSYAPKSKPALDYLALTEEILKEVSSCGKD